MKAVIYTLILFSIAFVGLSFVSASDVDCNTTDAIVHDPQTIDLDDQSIQECDNGAQMDFRPGVHDADFKLEGHRDPRGISVDVFKWNSHRDPRGICDDILKLEDRRGPRGCVDVFLSTGLVGSETLYVCDEVNSIFIHNEANDNGGTLISSTPKICTFNHI